MKRLVLLRHPETALNLSPVRLRGTLDVPLSPRGFSQIPQICVAMKTSLSDVKQVYSSPLARASILATAVAHEYGLKVQPLEEMKSRTYGVLDGKAVSEVLDVLKTLAAGTGRDLAPKNGESMNDFLVRNAEGIKKVIAAAPEEGCVVVVTHLQNIMLGRAYLEAGLPEDVSKMDYEYSEESEIAPGEWIEIKRVWTTNAAQA